MSLFMRACSLRDNERLNQPSVISQGFLLSAFMSMHRVLWQNMGTVLKYSHVVALPSRTLMQFASLCVYSWQYLPVHLYCCMHDA
jgi:hypothetical protein